MSIYDFRVSPSLFRANLDDSMVGLNNIRVNLNDSRVSLNNFRRNLNASGVVPIFLKGELYDRKSVKGLKFFFTF